MPGRLALEAITAEAGGWAALRSYPEQMLKRGDFTLTLLSLKRRLEAVLDIAVKLRRCGRSPAGLRDCSLVGTAHSAPGGAPAAARRVPQHSAFLEISRAGEGMVAPDDLVRRGLRFVAEGHQRRLVLHQERNDAPMKPGSPTAPAREAGSVPVSAQKARHQLRLVRARSGWRSPYPSAFFMISASLLVCRPQLTVFFNPIRASLAIDEKGRSRVAT